VAAMDRRAASARARSTGGVSSSGLGGPESRGADGTSPTCRTVVRFKTNMHNTVAYSVMRRRRGWVEVRGATGEGEDYDWDIFWGDINCFLAETGFQMGRVPGGALVNHFPRNYELCRKARGGVGFGKDRGARFPPVPDPLTHLATNRAVPSHARPSAPPLSTDTTAGPDGEEFEASSESGGAGRCRPRPRGRGRGGGTGVSACFGPRDSLGWQRGRG